MAQNGVEVAAKVGFDKRRLIVEYPADITERPKAPMVLMLGFWGCNDKILRKHAELYIKRGFVVTRFIAEGNETFGAPKLRKQLAQWLIHEASAVAEPFATHNAASGRPELLLHVMSNNGSILYFSVVELMAAGHLSWLRSSLRGVVYDMAPGELSPHIFVKAWLAMTGGGLRAYSTLLLPPLVLLLILKRAFRRAPVLATTLPLLALAFFGRTTWRSHCFSRTYHNVLAEDPTTCPQLFVTSKGDDLVHHKVVEELKAAREKKSAAVRFLRFETVGHMESLRQRPAEYEEAIDGFLSDVAAHRPCDMMQQPSSKLGR